jgi:hypothetical protein
MAGNTKHQGVDVAPRLLSSSSGFRKPRCRRRTISFFQFEDARFVFGRQTQQSLFGEGIRVFGETPATLKLLSQKFDVHHSPIHAFNVDARKRLPNSFLTFEFSRNRVPCSFPREQTVVSGLRIRERTVSPFGEMSLHRVNGITPNAFQLRAPVRRR